MLNGLDLFSGIGGISFALRDYVRPVAYCEIDPYCQGILLSRMEDRFIHAAPIWDDVRTLGKESGNFPRSFIDIIYGGFPCQDISVAGAGKGLEGERSGLFFEIMRLAEEIKPSFLFIENVPAITTRGGLQVVREIATLGYDCRWCVISAASVGALHKRDRWFLLAHSYGSGFGEQCREESVQTKQSPAQCDGYGCNAMRQPSEQTNQKSEPKQEEGRAWRRSSGQCWPFESREQWQEIVSGICRVSDGVPFHVDKLRSLGNAVVPQQTKKAFKILMGIK